VPLRDLFAAVFFVAVGMMVDPLVILDSWPAVLALTALVLVAQPVLVAFGTFAAGNDVRSSVRAGMSLAQIGEFSFILAGLGLSLGILPEQAQDLILAGAIISILINPAFFVLLDRFAPKEASDAATAEAAARRELTPTSLSGHYIVVGHGRVGSVIEEALRSSAVPMLVIEDHSAAVSDLDGVEVIKGNAADPEVLTAANPAAARCIFVAVPDAFEAGTIVERVREANPSVPIIARAHSEAEHQHLTRLGATHTVLGERELAREMLRKAGVSTEPSDVPPTTP
jgi:CPA2 family monovalent cation:H+ antiporter-2